jgi:hypothetical protein
VFYDVDHGAGHSGPPGYKPGSAWDIHPVTSFEFDPKTEHSLFALISRNSAFDRPVHRSGGKCEPRLSVKIASRPSYYPVAPESGLAPSSAP